MSEKSQKLLNRTLMHAAAKLYYIDGVSQLRVAEKLEVSTATVSRLLAGARTEGLVRFEVPDLEENTAMEDKLRRALNLKAVRVLESARPATIAMKVGDLVAETHLNDQSVVAIGWGRTIQSVISAGMPKTPGVTVVPTTGGMNQTASHFQINEFVRNAAEQMQGNACFFYVPSVVSAELKAGLERDPAITRVLDLWNRVDVAIVGIGNYQHATTMRDIELIPDGVSKVVGDVTRHYFYEDGSIAQWPDYHNLMAISVDQLRRIPVSIGVAIGTDKDRAIIGAARSGMINTLVTDERAAKAVIEKIEPK